MISPVAAWMTRIVEVVDEQYDGGAGEGSADADVVEAAVVAEGDFAGLSTRSWRTRNSVWRWWWSGVALGRVV